jgi:hypothetical protein
MMDGSRGVADYIYWTEPGTYRLRPTLRASIRQGDELRSITIHGAPTTIEVK